MNTIKLKSYRILYYFNHAKMGFSNSITIKALNVDLAIKDAEKQVQETYGSGMIKKFTFKPDPTHCGVC